MLFVGLASYIKGWKIEDFTNNQKSHSAHNVVPIPKRRHKARTVIQVNNQSGNPKPKLKRTRTRRLSSKKNNRHKTPTKHIQPNRKRKNNRQTTKRNRTTHKIDAHQVLKRQLISKAIPTETKSITQHNQMTYSKHLTPFIYGKKRLCKLFDCLGIHVNFRLLPHIPI